MAEENWYLWSRTFIYSIFEHFSCRGKILWAALFFWTLCFFDSPIISTQDMDTYEKLLCTGLPEIFRVDTVNVTHILSSIMVIPPTPWVHDGIHRSIKVPLQRIFNQRLCILYYWTTRGGLNPWCIIYKQIKNPRRPLLASHQHTICVLLGGGTGTHVPVQVWGVSVFCL